MVNPEELLPLFFEKYQELQKLQMEALAFMSVDHQHFLCDSSSGIWRYALAKSSFKKVCPPASDAKRSLILGKG